MAGRTLHVTNGEATAAGLRAAGLDGDVLPWNDVLHEGPVPSGLSLAELSRLRARFLSGWPWAPDESEVVGDFARRDAELMGARRADEIVLWFEHDLYDQLQLVQLLHWFEMRRDHARTLSLICMGAHPAVERFVGLGQLTPDQLAGLHPRRVGVSDEQYELGRLAWEAFTSSRPDRLQELAGDELTELPFLRAALRRLLEQFPSTRDGLARSERQILEAVADGPRPLGETFRVSQHEAEARPFMGDHTYLTHVAALAAGDRPLLAVADTAGLVPGASGTDRDYWSRRIELTDDDRAVLDGRIDRARLQPVDRWLGGVHLHGDPLPWRFDSHSRRVVEGR